jgi:hypothetical protein
MRCVDMSAGLICPVKKLQSIQVGNYMVSENGSNGDRQIPHAATQIRQIVGFDLLIYIPYTGILIYGPGLPSPPSVLTVGGLKW